MKIDTDVRALFFPYVLSKQKDGRYVLLNRRYKPVGFVTTDSIEYAKYPVSITLPGLTPRIASQLSCRADPNVDEIYLYSDQSKPTLGMKEMLAYQKKLALLATLDATDDSPQSL
jgi:hypothetical protein